MVLVCIFLVISDSEHLFNVLIGHFVHFLWRNVYLTPLPIFELGSLLFVIEL